MSRFVEIAGSLKELELPPECANCGNATSESLEVARGFRRAGKSGDSSSDRFVIARVWVPFCPPCTMQHLAEVRPIEPFQRLLLACRARSALGAPAFGALAVLAAYMATRSVSSTLPLALTALFVLLSWVSVRVAYAETEHLAVPPPTSVTSAFDFTDDQSGLFEREHRTVTLRNAVFADAFLLRNTTRIWNPENPANRKGGWRRFFQ